MTRNGDTLTTKVIVKNDKNGTEVASITARRSHWRAVQTPKTRLKTDPAIARNPVMTTTTTMMMNGFPLSWREGLKLQDHIEVYK